MILNFLSLNLWEGGKVTENVFPFIRQVNADVMCLQEAIVGGGSDLPENFRTIEVLKEIFPEYNYFFTPEVNKVSLEGKHLFGNLIVSKYAIMERAAWFFDKPYHGEWVEGEIEKTEYPSSFQRALLDIDGMRMNVLNVHGIWGWDGLDSPRRDRMSEMIAREVQGRENVILAGDFNLFPETHAVTLIEKHLQSVFGRELATSFNVKHKKYGNFATSVVDMMFVSRQFKVLVKDCPDVDVSDHRPLVVKLEI